MKDWKNINYLKKGNTIQKKAYKAIEALKILSILDDYNPILVGTIPIEIDIEGSDLDIICEVYDFSSFKDLIIHYFGHYNKFSVEDIISLEHHILVVNFEFMGFDFEIYAASKPSHTQNGYRHMLIEHRILRLLGDPFRDEVIKLKKSGLKTEPTFARLLGLVGNPYDELLNIFESSDEEIMSMFKGT